MANEILSTDFINISRAISAYSDEAYSEARSLTATGMVGADARISSADEDYWGTIRFYDTLGALNFSTTQTSTDTHINIADESPTNEGLVTEISTGSLRFAKSVRTHGATQMQVQQVVSSQDGFAKISRDFGMTRARDEDAALLSVLKGVAKTEVAQGARPADANAFLDSEGFFASVAAGGSLFPATNPLTPLLDAMGSAFSDQDDSGYTLIIDPATAIDMRKANLFDDQAQVTDGNVSFNTILQGMVRVYVTRAVGKVAISDFNSNSRLLLEDDTNNTQIKLSFMVRNSAIANTDVSVPNPVAFDRDESVGRGTGKTELWYRWGYIYHPVGYSYINGGSLASPTDVTAYVSNANLETAANWARAQNKASLGILPIFHTATDT